MASSTDSDDGDNNVKLKHIYSLNAVHMLRTAQTQTLHLSQMADNKASILMGATFVVFSIAVSRSMTGELPWSLTLLAVSAFLSSLCAVIAVLPSAGKPKGPVVSNPLFFGHFATRDEHEWVEDVLTRLESEDSIYRTMLHDIYQNGQVLHQRKYRFLGYAYRVFIAGLVVTLVAFALELATTY